MALNSYADLVASVKGWIAGSSDPALDTVIDSAIQMAEQGLNAGLRVPEMVRRAKLVVTGDYATVPSDFLSALDVYVEPANQTPRAIPAVNLDMLYGWRAIDDYPQCYCLRGLQMIVRPVPANLATRPSVLHVSYYGKVEPLSADTVCTAILARYPSVYLYATLGHMGGWLDDDPRVASWQQSASAAIQAANRANLMRESELAYW